MKVRVLITVLLAAVLLTGLWGCSVETMNQRVDAAEDAVGQRLDQVIQTANTSSPAGTLTKEQAQAIALEHAGFTADQVSYLRTEYEVDDGVPQYEVEFHQGRWEYNYEINAGTGAIMSYDMDD